MEFSINEIAKIINGETSSNSDTKINMMGKIQEAKSGHISFLSNPKYEPYLYTTEASAVIVKKGFIPKEKVSPILIYVEDPYSSFTDLLETYHKLVNPEKTGVENPSFIGEESTSGHGLYRGAFSYIGNNVKIGDHVKIHPQVYIGDNVEIGDHTVLHAGSKVYADVKIGNFCVIHAGAVIGSDGFGYAPQPDGSYKTIPQLGSVVLKDYVHIGANTVIDCATIQGDATILNEGVKLDNLIQIAHNSEVGKNTVMAAQSGLSGSSKIGEGCVVAGQVGISGHIEIADNTIIAAQSGISKTIKQPNGTIMGSPAFDHKEYLRSYAVFRNLPDLNTRIKQLEEKILNLPTFQEKQ